MEALSASLPREELNRIEFRLYERFRPGVPEGAQGWGTKGELRVERIVRATVRGTASPVCPGFAATV
jgi:hypothetical protein